MLVNLRTDPFENAEVCVSWDYEKWRADRVFMLLPAGALVQQYLQTMAEFPPRQTPEHWGVSDVLEEDSGEGAGAGNRLRRRG